MRRWIHDDSIFLLEPILERGSGERGTRWAFEKDTVLIEKTMKIPTAPEASCARKQRASLNRSTRKDGVQLTPTEPAAASSREHSVYRRACKLDPRVVIREDQERAERGRGLFALEDVPKGTELMRVRAVAVVVESSAKKTTCCRCFRAVNSQRPLTLRPCSDCGFSFCARCGIAESEEGHPHRDDCLLNSVMEGFGFLQADVGILRLATDLFVRRKKLGLVNDDEWEIMNTLQSQGSDGVAMGTGIGTTMGIGTGVGTGMGTGMGMGIHDDRCVQEARRKIQSLAGFDVSNDDMTMMYSRQAQPSRVFARVAFGRLA